MKEKEGEEKRKWRGKKAASSWIVIFPPSTRIPGFTTRKTCSMTAKCLISFFYLTTWIQLFQSCVWIPVSLTPPLRLRWNVTPGPSGQNTFDIPITPHRATTDTKLNLGGVWSHLIISIFIEPKFTIPRLAYIQVTQEGGKEITK